MLDHRVMFVDLLGDHGNGFGGSLKLWAVNHQLTFLWRATVQRFCRIGRCVAEMNRADSGVSGSSDTLDLESMVNNRVIVDGVIVNYSSVVVNLSDLRGRQPPMSKVMLVEIV